MNKASIKLNSEPAAEVPYQAASLDIWDKKYRLKKKDGTAIDATMDDSYQRIALTLAEVEATPSIREHWHGEFLWALRHGIRPLRNRLHSDQGVFPRHAVYGELQVERGPIRGDNGVGGRRIHSRLPSWVRCSLRLP